MSVNDYEVLGLVPADLDQTTKLLNQTLFVKHLRFALQTMFDRLATSQNIASKAERLSNHAKKKLQKHLLLFTNKKCLTSNVLRLGKTVKYFAQQANFKCFKNNV